MNTTKTEFLSKSAQVSAQIKTAIRQGYAWPGGYTLFGVTASGGCLCVPCMKANFKAVVWDRKNDARGEWCVIAIECAQSLEGREWIEENGEAEGFALTTCDNCNAILND